MRLVLCDDHRLLVTALASALDGLGYTIEAVVLTPEDAVHAVALHEPDVLLIDLGFPEGSGLDAARDVGVSHPRTRVVVLTGDDSPEALSAALEIGVAGYVRKAQRVEVIAAALDQAASGELAVDRELLRGLRDGRTAAPRQRTSLDMLTHRERQVLHLLVRGTETQEMVGELGVSASTVRTHIQSIFVKLDVHSRLQVVSMLDRSGLLNTVEESHAPEE